MTPKRAKEIRALIDSGIRRLSEVCNENEISEIKRVWNKLSGDCTMWDALVSIENAAAGEEPRHGLRCGGTPHL